MSRLVIVGNPGADLARGLSMNTPTKYRHANEDRLLKLYHDTVNKELNGKIPFTLDQVSQIKQNTPNTMLILLKV